MEKMDDPLFGTTTKNGAACAVGDHVIPAPATSEFLSSDAQAPESALNILSVNKASKSATNGFDALDVTASPSLLLPPKSLTSSIHGDTQQTSFPSNAEKEASSFSYNSSNSQPLIPLVSMTDTTTQEAPNPSSSLLSARQAQVVATAVSTVSCAHDNSKPLQKSDQGVNEEKDQHYSDCGFRTRTSSDSSKCVDNSTSEMIIDDGLLRTDANKEELPEARSDFSQTQDVTPNIVSEVLQYQQGIIPCESERKLNEALQKIEELEAKVCNKSNEIEKLERLLVNEREINVSLREERDKAVEDKGEEERKQIALTNRLNVAKKKEAVKADLAERFEDEVKTLKSNITTTNARLAEVVEAKEALDSKLKEFQKQSNEQLHHAESLLADERTLNEERKRKMRLFVEGKVEELRQLKEENETLQAELNQTNQNLKETHNRWKTQHAQWVQAQTRNRELQRDLNRIKKDSENLHKFGDTLEMKLSRSATETEEHKSKRLAAKQELMTVLRTLEAEREISAKLRDSLKFTFTPKALSQQQLLKEGLEHFEEQLRKLSLRVGKSLPSLPESGNTSKATVPVESEDMDTNGDDEATLSRTETDVSRLISKLEFETQRTSQCIMAFLSSIERMKAILDASGVRTCLTALSEIVSTGSMLSSPAARALAADTSRQPLTTIRSHQYGQLPIAAEEFLD